MSAVLLHVENDVAFITLNREEKMNAFNREMALALQHILDECRDDERVRAICITGKGRAFSAGQDLAEVADPAGRGLEVILSEQFNPIVVRIRKIAKPVVAAVNGVAAGAGANIALCCDVVVASSSAVFIQAFSQIGLIPDSGGTFFLPRLIGWQKASALMMLGEKVNAAEAERLGMIYKVFPDESMYQETMTLMLKLAQMPTAALGLTKEALNNSSVNGLDRQLNIEDRLQTIAGQTADFREGMGAFLEKRKAHYVGK
jgi:2-(1,2-epoxy-1,2-dihydrophenyl)acetyl-CoA isomerase